MRRKMLYDEISADYADMIYARTVPEVDAKRSGVPAQMARALPPVAASLEEAATNSSPSCASRATNWKSIRTTNAIERLHEEFKRRIKTRQRTSRPAPDRLHAVLGHYRPAGRITLRKSHGWKTWISPCRANS